MLVMYVLPNCLTLRGSALVLCSRGQGETGWIQGERLRPGNGGGYWRSLATQIST